MLKCVHRRQRDDLLPLGAGTQPSASADNGLLCAIHVRPRLWGHEQRVAWEAARCARVLRILYRGGAKPPPATSANYASDATTAKSVATAAAQPIPSTATLSVPSSEPFSTTPS